MAPTIDAAAGDEGGGADVKKVAIRPCTFLVLRANSQSPVNERIGRVYKCISNNSMTIGFDWKAAD